MASRNSVTGFALFSFVFAVILSLAGAQSLAPAPAPTSDGKPLYFSLSLLPRYSHFQI
ncbi:arabinogalactan protein 16 [Arabidopsis thaliana]|uniref:Arabinogalactan protein 16 n=1 Tax=Arabidopsis thaliana TaxID=3702 RepID=Q3EBF3_ARATH|nr:arabinogalactan protein 16 [Arabidopsis thaliana]AEC10679.1 arabinogalactan protein 16 [Arabidopsis thaliana]|eukprot:NP_973699.1 arabinogalactan protein 16 [Arabidopsis thaliana]